MSYAALRRSLKLVFLRLWKGHPSDVVHEQIKTQSENRERNQDKDYVEIVAALDRISHQYEGAAQENKATEFWKEIREWMTVIIVFITACAILAQWYVMQRQTDLMQGQLNEMTLEQRPWIRVKPVISGPFEFQGTWGETPIAAPVRFFLKNVGHSPAFNVRLVAWGFLSGVGKDLLAEQKSHCDLLRAKPLDDAGRGAILFPEEDIPAEETNGGIDSFPVLSASDIATYLARNGQNQGVDFWIYGCADYAFGREMTHHQTPFIYRLGHAVRVNGVVKGATLGIDPENTPKSDLFILPSPSSGREAD